MSDFGGVHRYNVTAWPTTCGLPLENPEVVHGLLRHLMDKIETTWTT
jgi:2-oxoglutarate ferredoxin oxidoreductase subunit alpha